MPPHADETVEAGEKPGMQMGVMGAPLTELTGQEDDPDDALGEAEPTQLP